MKRELVSFIAVVGLVLLGAALVLGLLTGLLFAFPNFSIFGARAVNERNTQIVYCDEALTNAFANGKFILESSGTHIEVKMSNKGYKWANTIVVEESATGIAFNSLNRTLIEWTQTKYDNEVYYRIKVLEPSGMVFSDKPTTVYINLPHRDDEFEYDFVLQNRYSPVNFSFVSPEPVANDALLIDSLVVESAASVNIPYKSNNSVNNIKIKGNNTKFNCEAKVLSHVVVEGNKNTVNVGSTNTGIVGDVAIRGNNNRFTGTSASNVIFNADNGSLSMSKNIASLNVKTVNASINVKNVTGAATMKTQAGSLTAESIGGGLTFNAGSISQANATANLTVNALAGTTVVENYGTGSINFSNVNGDVDITSKEVNGGAINVAYASNADSGHKVKILGYDGNINVRGIKGGEVNIGIEGTYRQAGFATVSAQFETVGTAVINTGAYPSGHDGLGDVNLAFSDNCSVKLNVFDARHLGHNDRYKSFINDNNAISKGTDVVDNLIRFNPSAPLGTVRVDCQNSVYLY